MTHTKCLDKIHYAQLLFDFCFKRPFLAGGLRQQRKRAIWSGLFWVLSCLSSGTHFRDSFCPLQFRLFPFSLPAMRSLAWKWWGKSAHFNIHAYIVAFSCVKTILQQTCIHVWNPMEHSIETGSQISINCGIFFFSVENVLRPEFKTKDH